QSGSGLVNQGYFEIANTFRSTLNAQSPAPIAVHVENLDLTRFGGPQHEKILHDYLQQKYAERPIGILVAVGSSALRFALRLRAESWSEIPIVFAAVDEDTAAQPAISMTPSNM